MTDVDTLRRSEAEARQEMPKRTCSNCGDIRDDCDTFQCSECKEYFCCECWVANSDNVCTACLEKEDIFNEAVGEAEEYAVVMAERDRDDRLTGDKI